MKMRKISLFLLVFLFTVQLVAAVGVTSPYWDNKLLGLHPGESIEVQLLLQNMVGEKDVTLVASITEGAEIATLLGKNQTYVIPFGVKDVPVVVRIALPEDASVGEARKVKVSFTQVATEDAEGKMVQMTAGVGAIIPIEVTPWVGSPKEESLLSPTLMVVVIVSLGVAGGVGYLYYRRKKNSA